MIPTKRARRVVAALAVPAILLTAAACGSDDGSSSSGPLAAVSGKPGEQPTIEFDEDAAAGKTSVEVLTEGDGAEVKQGDMLGMDVIGKTTGEQSDLVNTWMTQDGQPTTSDETPRPQLVTQAGVESALPEAITEPLIGTQVAAGSRSRAPRASCWARPPTRWAWTRTRAWCGSSTSTSPSTDLLRDR